MNSELFDPQIKNYVIEVTTRDSSGWGFNASIDKDDDNIIGTIKTFGAIEKKTVLFDNNNSVVLTAIKKVFSVRANYTIYDANENSIGNVRTVGTLHGKLKMFNLKGELILRKRDQSKIPRLYEIISNDGKVIAKHELIEEYVEKKWYGRIKYLTYKIQFNESNFNRKLLWGFFISDISSKFDINYYEDAPVSG